MNAFQFSFRFQKDKCVPENIHASPTDGIFSNTPLEIPGRLHTFLYIFYLPNTPIPQEIPIPSVGGVWIFS